jgi:hypothetical protein
VTDATDVCSRTGADMILLVLQAALLLGTGAAPAAPRDLDALIDDFLGGLYDRYYAAKPGSDIYDQMQGDQPRDDNNQINGDLSKFLSVNFSDTGNMTDYFRTSRNR